MKKLILLMLFVTFTCSLSASIDKIRYVRSAGEASVLVRPSPINPDIIGDPKPKETIELIQPEDVPVRKHSDQSNENKKPGIPGPVTIPAEVVYGDHVSKRENVPHNLNSSPIKKHSTDTAHKVSTNTDNIAVANPSTQFSKINKREDKPKNVPANLGPQTLPAQLPQNIPSHSDSTLITASNRNKREDKQQNGQINPQPEVRPALPPQNLPLHLDILPTPVPKITKRDDKPQNIQVNLGAQTLPAQHSQNLPSHPDSRLIPSYRNKREDKQQNGQINPHPEVRLALPPQNLPLHPEILPTPVPKITKREDKPHIQVNLGPQTLPAQQPNLPSYSDSRLIPSDRNNGQINPQPEVRPALPPQNLPLIPDILPTPVPKITKRDDTPQNIQVNLGLQTLPAQHPQNLPSHSDSTSIPASDRNKRENVYHPKNVPPCPLENANSQEVDPFTNQGSIEDMKLSNEKRDIPVPVKPSSKAPPSDGDEKKLPESTEPTSTTKDIEKKPHRPVPVRNQ